MKETSSNISRRIIRLQEKLSERGLLCAIVSSADNLFYLSGWLMGQGNGPSMAAIPVSGEAVLVIPEGETSLPGVMRFPGTILPYYYEGPVHHDPSAPVRALIERFEEKITPPLGIEPDWLSCRDATILGIPSHKATVDIDNEIRAFRMIKGPEEIELMRTACGVADVGQAKAKVVFREGVDEISLQSLARSAMESSAGLPIECKADVLFGERTALIGGPEGSAGKNKAKLGGPAIVDLLPRVNGYYADTTRTLWIGTVPKEGRKVLNLLSELKGRLEELLRPGVEAQVIDDAARRRLSKEGSFPHHTGHGIGISSFEAPFITQGSSDVLEEGMVITLEPGLYFDNWGARIEDDYLITNDGFEKLSGLKDA